MMHKLTDEIIQRGYDIYEVVVDAITKWGDERNSKAPIDGEDFVLMTTFAMSLLVAHTAKVFTNPEGAINQIQYMAKKNLSIPMKDEIIDSDIH